MDKIIADVIEREGGFVDNPADKGGPTKFGITQTTLAAWRGHDVSVADVENLSANEAADIYQKNYLDKPGLGAVCDEALRGVLLDCSVNHGPKTAIRFLQRALGVKDDGVIGPVTLAALPYINPRPLARRILAERIKFFGRLIAKDLTDKDKDGIPDNTEFAAGWLARVADQLETLA